MKKFYGWKRMRTAIQSTFPNGYTLAVSGGADSMFMLDFISQIDIPYVVAHFNHGNRGIFDDTDMKFVQEYCSIRNIPCEVGYGDAEKILKAPSLESECRDQRYSFLKSVMGKYGHDRIITGHNADDQAETVLMRMLRGASFDNLVMKEDNGIIFRPFLGLTKEQILDQCARNNIKWIEDETNKDVKHLRNWFRHEVIPLISKRCNTQVISRTAMRSNNSVVYS